MRGRVSRLHKAECVLLLRRLRLLLAAHLIVVHEGEGVLLLLLGLAAVVDVHASEEVSLLLLRRLLWVHEAKAGVRLLHLRLLRWRWPSKEVEKAILRSLLWSSRLCGLLDRLRLSSWLCGLEGSRSFWSHGEAASR